MFELLNAVERISKGTKEVVDLGVGPGGPDFPALDFLMKRVLYFATKLNSRDIQKCDCLWVPSVICVFPVPTAGFHRLRNT